MVSKIFSEKKFFVILILAIVAKLCLFVFGTMKVPESRMLYDSSSYLETAKCLAEKGQFARENQDQVLEPESFRTPGYPAFLAFFHHHLKVPIIGILLIQLMLTVAAGLITYRVAQHIDKKIALLSATIVLFDPPVSIFSVMVLTETLFLVLLALFLLAAIQYFKNRKLYWLGWSAIFLALATYVRPISYFLAIPLAGFILFAHRAPSFKRVIRDVAVFFLLVYGLLGAWQVRNYLCCQTASFATVGSHNFIARGFFKDMPKQDHFLSQGCALAEKGWTCFVSMMTQPGSLKYFKNKFATTVGKCFFYPWMAFWLLGFLAGCYGLKKNIFYQFLFLVVLYFLAVTILNIGVLASERFRAPMMPAIAILSAFGWSEIILWLKGKNKV